MTDNVIQFDVITHGKTRVKFNDGVYDISNEEYHASHGFSRSNLLNFLRSPFHFKKLLGCHKEQTDAMKIGNMLHTLVLEPEKFDDRYVKRPSVDRRTNAGKLAYNQFIGTLMGREEVKEDDVEKAQCMANSILSDTYAAGLLKDFKAEQSVFFTHALGVQCKVRPDAWKREDGVIIDLKTTSSASFRAFQSSAIKFGYFLQAAMTYKALKYHDLPFNSFVIIAVENEYPYATALYVMDEEAIDFGVEQLDSIMTNLQKCLLQNQSPSYPARKLTVPGWASISEDIAEVG